MRSNHLIGLSTVAAALLGVISSANSAVTVIGNGLGANCFQAAEFGADAKAGIETCTAALDQTALTISDRAATYINRGILRARTGDTTGALADYNQGLGVDGKLGEGYVDRGAVYIVLERYGDALKDIDQGLAIGANKPHIAYYDRAIVDEAMGNIRGAYLDYKKALELQPDFALASEQLTRFKVIRKGSGSP
jgi:tetratricopeptide (TPR) repeat protein